MLIDLHSRALKAQALSDYDPEQIPLSCLPRGTEVEGGSLYTAYALMFLWCVVRDQSQSKMLRLELLS